LVFISKYLLIPLGEKQTSFTFEGVSKDYKLPAMFKGWDIFVAKTPMLDSSHPLFFTSPWTASCNIIMLDHVCVWVQTLTLDTLLIYFIRNELSSKPMRPTPSRPSRTGASPPSPSPSDTSFPLVCPFLYMKLCRILCNLSFLFVMYLID